MPMKLPVVGKDSYGYLIDVIITRDVWMHRIDIARAAGKELELTDDYNGRVHRLCGCRLSRRHGRPFMLVLDGAVGGSTSRAAPVRPRSIASTPSSSVASCRDEARAQDRSSFRRSSDPMQQTNPIERERWVRCLPGGTDHPHRSTSSRSRS